MLLVDAPLARSRPPATSLGALKGGRTAPEILLARNQGDLWFGNSGRGLLHAQDPLKTVLEGSLGVGRERGVRRQRGFRPASANQHVGPRAGNSPGGSSGSLWAAGGGARSHKRPKTPASSNFIFSQSNRKNANSSKMESSKDSFSG